MKSRRSLRALLPSLTATLFVLMGASPLSFAQQHAVAITIDDLPRGGDGGSYNLATLQAMTRQLLAPFREQKIPVTGFVNAGRGALPAQDLRSMLDLWLDAGADLGNHSFSHPDLNSVPLADYEADVLKGEPALRAVLEPRGKKLIYYRHPFLHLGTTAADKKGLQDFLDAHGYRVAPVTFDTSDYMYAALYQRADSRERARAEYIPYMESVVAFFEQRAVEVVGHEFPQILLMHANQLNADTMPELLAMFRKRGYRFVSLDEALRDPAYQSGENYIGRGGFSWIHRWSRFKGMPNKGEPDPSEWALKTYDGPR